MLKNTKINLDLVPGNIFPLSYNTPSARFQPQGARASHLGVIQWNVNAVYRMGLVVLYLCEKERGSNLRRWRNKYLIYSINILLLGTQSRNEIDILRKCLNFSVLNTPFSPCAVG